MRETIRKTVCFGSLPRMTKFHKTPWFLIAVRFMSSKRDNVLMLGIVLWLGLPQVAVVDCQLIWGKKNWMPRQGTPLVCCAQAPVQCTRAPKPSKRPRS